MTDDEILTVGHAIIALGLNREPHWNFEENTYRIKPKEKVKKTVKHLCFENAAGYLLFVKEEYAHPSLFGGNTRITEFDMTREIEVEE